MHGTAQRFRLRLQSLTQGINQRRAGLPSVGIALLYRNPVFDELDVTFRARQAPLQDGDQTRRLACVGTFPVTLLDGLLLPRNFDCRS
jgi:hypothetical protein